MNFNKVYQTESQKEYFKCLMDFIDQEYEEQVIYPPRELVFAAFEYLEAQPVKVVILGQDPYFNKEQAHGLAFSVNPDCPLPKSLKNIYQELANDLGINRCNGDLRGWAKQGVLMLNTILTVREGKPLSHKNKGWEIFTDEVIKILNEKETPVVFILWGAEARKYKKKISNIHHLIIESAHPSPLSAYQGFFGSKPFSRVNEFLKSHGMEQIKWDK